MLLTILMFPYDRVAPLGRGVERLNVAVAVPIIGVLAWDARLITFTLRFTRCARVGTLASPTVSCTV